MNSLGVKNARYLWNITLPVQISRIKWVPTIYCNSPLSFHLAVSKNFDSFTSWAYFLGCNFCSLLWFLLFYLTVFSIWTFVFNSLRTSLFNYLHKSISQQSLNFHSTSFEKNSEKRFSHYIYSSTFPKSLLNAISSLPQLISDFAAVWPLIPGTTLDFKNSSTYPIRKSYHSETSPLTHGLNETYIN